MAKSTPGPYIIGQPGGPSGPFYSLVNPQGRVVAMQIPNKADAHLLQAAPVLLECCMGADALLSYLHEQALLPEFRVGDGDDMTMKLLRDLREILAAVKGGAA